jgi:hypothetical protein
MGSWLLGRTRNARRYEETSEVHDRPKVPSSFTPIRVESEPNSACINYLCPFPRSFSMSINCICHNQSNRRSSAIPSTLASLSLSLSPSHCLRSLLSDYVKTRAHKPRRRGEFFLRHTTSRRLIFVVLSRVFLAFSLPRSFEFVFVFQTPLFFAIWIEWRKRKQRRNGICVTEEKFCANFEASAVAKPIEK